MSNFCYLRSSTNTQTVQQQLLQINNAGYEIDRDRVFIESGVSGKVPALQRDQFSKLNERLHDGDVLITVELSRLGRDILDVISTIRNLIDRGVRIVILGLGTLDNTPQSNLTMNLLAAISDFERQLISIRTKAKLNQLKAEGVKLGRPVKITDENLKLKANQLLDSGISWRKTAKELGIALSTLQRMMK